MKFLIFLFVSLTTFKNVTIGQNVSSGSGIIDYPLQSENERYFKDAWFFKEKKSNIIYFIQQTDSIQYSTQYYKKNNKWVTTYENGNIKEEGKFKSFKLNPFINYLYNYQVRKGVWKFYSEEGILIQELRYKNGKKLK